VNIRVKYFGMVAERTLRSEEAIAMESNQTIEDLHHLLLQRYPDLASAEYRLSHNQKLSEGNEIMSDGDEIALLPPFAGG